MRGILRLVLAVGVIVPVAYFAGDGAAAYHPYAPYALLPCTLFMGHMAGAWAAKR